MSKKNNQATRRNLHAARLASASAASRSCLHPPALLHTARKVESTCHPMLMPSAQFSAHPAEEKEEAEKRKAKQEHKAARLAAADRMGVQAPKRLKKKAKKGVRIKKHVVVRVSLDAQHGQGLALAVSCFQVSRFQLGFVWTCL